MKEMLELLFEATLSANVFILAILVVRLLFKNSAKGVRLFLWLLVGIKLVLPFNFESNLSLLPQGIGQQSYENTNAVIHSGEFVANQTAEQQLLSNEAILTILWAIGTVAVLVYGLISFWRLHKNIRGAVKREGNVFESERVISPFVLGVIKPKIYIPFNLDEETYLHIISHEKSHIKNFDHITKLVSFVVFAIYWFNPLVWVCYKLFTKDIELACDERVVKSYTQEKRKSYAEALLSCAMNEGRGIIYPLAFGEVSIKERITLVVSYKKTLKVVYGLFLLASVVAIACFATVPEASAKNNTENETVITEPTTEMYVEETTQNNVEPTTEPTTESATENETEAYRGNYEAENSVEYLTININDFVDEDYQRWLYYINNGHYPPETTKLDYNNLPPADGNLSDSDNEEFTSSFNFSDLN